MSVRINVAVESEFREPENRSEPDGPNPNRWRSRGQALRLAESANARKKMTLASAPKARFKLVKLRPLTYSSKGLFGRFHAMVRHERQPRTVLEHIPWCSSFINRSSTLASWRPISRIQSTAISGAKPAAATLERHNATAKPRIHAARALTMGF